MNAGRDVERLIADWLVEESPGRAPDRILATAAHTIDRTKQRPLAAERGLRIPWRLRTMNSLTRLAAIAVVAVVAVGGAVYLLRQPVAQNVGTSSAGPATVEGIWEVTFTRDEMLAAGISNSSDDNPANYGHFKLDLHGGLFKVTELTDPKATDNGWYTIAGSTMTFQFLSIEPITVPFTVSSTTLTIGRGVPVYLYAKPWTRTGP